MQLFGDLQWFCTKARRTQSLTFKAICELQLLAIYNGFATKARRTQSLIFKAICELQLFGDLQGFCTKARRSKGIVKVVLLFTIYNDFVRKCKKAIYTYSATKARRTQSLTFKAICELQLFGDLQWFCTKARRRQSLKSKAICELQLFGDLQWFCDEGTKDTKLTI